MIGKDEALQWIAEIFEEPPDLVKPETPQEEILGWDSLGVLTLIAGFDERFDIALSEADIAEFRKVDDILELLRRHGKLEE
jgi:acyl carrier protein